MNDVNDGDGHTKRHDDISQSVFFFCANKSRKKLRRDYKFFVVSSALWQERLFGDVCTALQRDIVVMSIEREHPPQRERKRESTQKCKHRKVNKPLSLAHCWPANKN